MSVLNCIGQSQMTFQLLIPESTSVGQGKSITISDSVSMKSSYMVKQKADYISVSVSVRCFGYDWISLHYPRKTNNFSLNETC